MELIAGPMRLRLAPALGGAICGWWRDDVALLRETPPGCPDVRDHASFPLIPFSNRIAHGRFSFGGQDFTLPRDPRDPRHALHGNALYAAWEVGAATTSEALLRLVYRSGTPFFPFAYTAWQRYRLTAAGLTIGLAVRNDDARPFPSGLGHHLYFPRAADTRLRFQAAGHWRTGPDGLPTTRSTAHQAEFAAGAALAGLAFDNAFFGWHRQADITYPAGRYALHLRASPALAHAVLFTPPARAFFAFEPVSHAVDAINRQAMRVLGPGEALTAVIRCQWRHLPV